MTILIKWLHASVCRRFLPYLVLWYNFHCMFWGAIYWYLVLKIWKLLLEGRIFSFLMAFCVSHHCNMQVFYTNGLFSRYSLWSELHGIPFFLVCGDLTSGNKMKCIPKSSHLTCDSQRLDTSEPLAVAVTFHACYLVVIAASASQTGTTQTRVFQKKYRYYLEVWMNSGAETSFRSVFLGDFVVVCVVSCGLFWSVVFFSLLLLQEGQGFKDDQVSSWGDHVFFLQSTR